MSEYEIILPGGEALIESLRSVGYSLPAAVEAVEKECDVLFIIPRNPLEPRLRKMSAACRDS